MGRRSLAAASSDRVTLSTRTRSILNASASLPNPSKPARGSKSSRAQQERDQLDSNSLTNTKNKTAAVIPAVRRSTRIRKSARQNIASSSGLLEKRKTKVPVQSKTRASLRSVKRSIKTISKAKSKSGTKAGRPKNTTKKRTRRTNSSVSSGTSVEPVKKGTGKKRKSLNDTSTTVTPKKLKRGELIPKLFITEYVVDPTFEEAVPIPFVSTTAHSKLLIRAVLLNDLKLLQKLCQEKDAISSFCVPRSVKIDRDAVSYAIETGNVSALKILMSKTEPKHLAPQTQWLIEEEKTGYGSRMMFGHALRAVTIGRGGKEGNAALLKDRNVLNCPNVCTGFSVNHIQEALKYGLAFSTLEKMKGLYKSDKDYFMNQLLNNVYIAVRSGHCGLASTLIGIGLNKGGFGFNNLHHEALTKSKQDPLSPFRSQSVGKKAIHNARITPLCCAAVNPDPYCLSKLLTSTPLYTVVDLNNWSLVHYAAACSGTGPLEFLISRGVATNQVNRDGDTPLHIAARNGRFKNAEVILKVEKKKEDLDDEDDDENEERNSKRKVASDAFSVTRVNKIGQTVFHLACSEGQLEVVKILLGSPLVDKNKPTPAKFGKLTPLMLAAEHGHLPTVKYLVETGAKLNAKDKRGNTALTHAVINGHAHIVSYLLRIGDDPLRKDSSGNTLIHYACAYGWYFNLMLLMKAGCCPNEPNLWKLTPLAISFMKGHMGLVEILLKEPGVNIDAPIDDKGLNLLLQTCSSQPSQEVVDRLKYLTEEQKADCQAVDYEKNNAIHYLLRSEAREIKRIQKDRKRGWEVEGRENDYTLEALKLLISHGTSLDAKNSSQETPISLAVNLGCLKLAHQMLKLGGYLSAEPNSNGDTVLHLLIQHLTDECNSTAVIDFYKDCAKDPKLLAAMKSMCQTYNHLSMTPLLLTLNRYSSLSSPDEVKKVVEFVLFLVIKLDSDVNAVMKTKESPDANDGNTVLHLAASLNYAEDILNILLTKKPNLDPINSDLRTPLTLSILKRNNTATKILIENGADVNYVSPKDGGKSMLLLEASQIPNDYSLIPLFVSKKAAVRGIVDGNNGNSILHFISKNPTGRFAVEAIKVLVKSGGVINKENKYFRTSIHLAVNSRGGETDISYEVEDALIEAGANLAMRDANGRIPLHFAFLKIGKANKKKKHGPNSFMDPIELVTLLTSAMKESGYKTEIECADEFGQTPLHMAAIRGATISASHLLSESSKPLDSINRPDNNGNTPFALAVLNGHEGCALMFLQAGADFIMELSSGVTKALRDEQVEESWIWKPVRDEAERQDRENAKLSQYSILQEIVQKDWQGLLYLMLEKLKSTGSGVTPGIEAAIKTKRLKLAFKLINRVRTIEQLVTKKQSLLHTLAQHALTSGDDNCQIQSKIVENLVNKRADVNAIDSHNATPLIYAAVKWNAHLCSEFTKLMNPRQIPSLKPDFTGRTPFSALFWEPILPDTDFPLELKAWAEMLLFSGSEGNILCQYPIRCPAVANPGVRYNELGSATTNLFMANIATKFSPLIMAVIYGNKKIVKWLVNLQGKIDINFPDSGGRTPLMHAARLNDIRMVKLLLSPNVYDFETDRRPWAIDAGKSKKSKQANKVSGITITSGVNLNVVDKDGWSVIHHLVAPLNSTSSIIYARADIILKILASNGANLDTKTHEGETPLDMALRLRKFAIAKSLAALISPVATKALEQRIRDEYEYESLPEVDDNIQPTPLESAHQDSKLMLESLKSGLKNLEVRVEPDPLTDFTTENSMVLVDEVRNVPFDCLLTQVDISYGVFGLYNFYKMQLIKKTKGPELVVLFTRWGRMGETGQFQKTPFPTPEEAIAEFKKIFKAKSGNVWDELGTTDFVPLPKKYKLVSLNRSELSKFDSKVSEVLKINFDKLEGAGETNGSELHIDIFQLMKNLVLEHKSKPLDWNNDDDDDNLLTFGQIELETLKKAEQILDQIEAILVKENSSNGDSSSLALLSESVLKLSEEYFTLLPLHGYALEKIQPMSDFYKLRKHQQLVRSFLHYEFAFELLLAAQWNFERKNPFDYVYSAVGTKIQTLEEASEEAQLILQFIHSTSTSPMRPVVQKIYRVQIAGTEESLDGTGIGNRQFLWHGTHTCNLLSILHRGLQISPLGYTFNGSLFGKGIYFSDMFEKSAKYSETVEKGRPKYMLLCEVALGQIQDAETGYWVSQDNVTLNPGKNSLKTSNSRWLPDPSVDVLWKGRKMTLGQPCENILPESEEDDYQRHGLDYNEYIIFKPEQANIKYLVQFQGSFPDISLKNLIS